METDMNIGGAGLECATEALKTNCMNTIPPRSANNDEVPVGFYEHMLMYIAPHIAEDRQSCIAKAAYCRAEHRRFAPGHELDDWLAAETEVDQRLAGEGCVY
jgi:hypothetical protein